MDAAIQAVWQARNSDRAEDAVAAREQARALLSHAPLDSPLLAFWVQQVAQLYQGANWNAQARAVLQEALARTAPLADSHPSRNALLVTLSGSWRQDGNLLKAVAWLEQAAAAQPATPTSIYTYTSLASLYQQLGRPDAVAAIAVKIRALASNNQSALAQFCEQQGQLQEAAAIYRTLAGESADPQAKASAWQALANLDARQEHYSDAVAAAQQAIAAAQSSDTPWVRDQAVWMRQNMATYLRQAGQLDQAEQVYRQLLQADPGGARESQTMTAYAYFLSETNRAAQAESLLKDYLAGHSNLGWCEKRNALLQLAGIASKTGNSQAADEYRQAGEALLPLPPPPARQTLIVEEMRKAQEAGNQRHWDDAYNLTLHALDTAAQASDLQQLVWSVPQVAEELAANKEPARGEQLFQRLLTLTQTWPADSRQPQVAAVRNYVRFLMNQPDRVGDVPAAIEQCRIVLTDANGPDSASLAEPLRFRIELALSHSQWQVAEASARELLALQESLTGNTGEFYLGDLQTAARVHEAAADPLRALPLRRQAVALAEEAVALQQTMRSPGAPLAQRLEQIRQMKQAATPVA
jgi:tetratricopeptide (TPR) repeat protein